MVDPVRPGVVDPVRPGFTLVEVIVALVLLSVGALAVTASGMAAARLMARAHHDEFVMDAVSMLADSLAMAEADGTGESSTGNVRLAWSAMLSPDSLLRTIIVRGSIDGTADTVTLTSARVVR